MEPPTTCVTDNNSANLAFMAIATKRAHLELQDEIFTLKINLCIRNLNYAQP